MEKNTKLDLSTYEFPNATGVDVVFATFESIPELVEEARLRGFYNGHTKANDKFNEIFFKGGMLQLQKDVNGTWKEKALSYARVLMGSFALKHQEKEAVCAMIFSETLIL